MIYDPLNPSEFRLCPRSLFLMFHHSRYHSQFILPTYSTGDDRVRTFAGPVNGDSGFADSPVTSSHPPTKSQSCTFPVRGKILLLSSSHNNFDYHSLLHRLLFPTFLCSVILRCFFNIHLLTVLG